VKVGFTFDLKTHYTLGKNDPEDLYAELDDEETVDAVRRALMRSGHEIIPIGNAFELLKRARPGAPDFDIVFNICEGLRGRNREAQVPVILEMMGIPYVGSDGLTLSLTLDKMLAKKVLMSEGILTPRSFIASSRDDIPRDIPYTFPLIVKPCYEGSSKGLTDESLVKDRAALERQIEKITGVYKQPVLVEEFISGMEFTVAIIGNEDPLILEPIQVSIDGDLDLGERFYTYTLLMSPKEELQYVCPAKISDALKNKLKETALRAYRAFDCKDFGRVDFRTDARENVYVLETNPLPSLHTDDAFGVIPPVMGKTYDDMVMMVLNAGIARHGLGSKNDSLHKSLLWH
jgi:D-alanine-D-alanine ligase